MTFSLPAVRIALVGLVLVTLAAVAGAGLHLASRERQAVDATADVLRAHASATALALEARAGTPGELVAAFEPFAAVADRRERVLVDGAGRVAGATNADFARAVDWGVTLSRAGSGRATEVEMGTAHFLVAAAPVGGSGMVVATAQRLEASGGFGETLAWTFALWGVLAGALALGAWAGGPRTAARLTDFGERIARGDADPSAMRAAPRGLGALAGAFAPVVARLKKSEADRAEQREHVAALYQVNPHFLLLCTLDGHIVEANPAFYAVTGMPPEAIRDGRAEALDSVFPMGPLFDLARRSLAEGAAIGGVEYGIVDRDDQPRPVEVSLKAFRAGGQDAVLIQATDVAARRRLQARVEAFTDTLDLMVDQRVAQLTAGQQSLRRILDAAGVVVASFDAGGVTRRWSGGARALTGREIGDVPHFLSVVEALGMSDADRSAFTAWFWNPSGGPYLGRHVAERDGSLREMHVVWHKVEADVPGRADARTLVGAPVPAVSDVSDAGDSGAFVGDGLAGEIPSPVRTA